MGSMENFFDWVTKPIPDDEVIIWFNIHNMTYEKIELYGDIFKSLFYIIKDTYMGDIDSNFNETKITLTSEDKLSHFEWCWNKIVENFKKENIIISDEGDHKEYFMSFYMETFYGEVEQIVKDSIPKFLDELFNMSTSFTKSDLDMITEAYKVLEKNVH